MNRKGGENNKNTEVKAI